jgi:hypothetical protein
LKRNEAGKEGCEIEGEKKEVNGTGSWGMMTAAWRVTLGPRQLEMLKAGGYGKGSVRPWW